MQLADVLILADKKSEAVALLLPLADQYANEGFAAKAVSVLKKIQKVDPGRRDVDARLARLIQEKQREAVALPLSRAAAEPAADEGGGGGPDLEIGFSMGPISVSAPSAPASPEPRADARGRAGARARGRAGARARGRAGAHARTSSRCRRSSRSRSRRSRLSRCPRSPEPAPSSKSKRRRSSRWNRCSRPSRPSSLRLRQHEDAGVEDYDLLYAADDDDDDDDFPLGRSARGAAGRRPCPPASSPTS